MAPDGRFLRVNWKLCEIVGYSIDEMLERTFRDITHPDDLNNDLLDKQRLLAGETETYTTEKRYLHKSGEIVWVNLTVSLLRDETGMPGGFVSVVEDITRRKETELQLNRHREELAHMDRVLIMGELAASLAHELNQPLTAILSNAQACRRFTDADPIDLGEIREALDDIIHGTKRAGEMIRHLRSLVKKGERDFTPLDLNSLVSQVVLLLHPYIVTHNVIVVQELAPELPLLMGDRIQLEQVLLNLLLNAIYAMDCRPAPARCVRVRTSMGSPDMVRLAVRDNGAGIPPDKLERIFQPFFTTKAEGTGMGLSVSFSIIQSHGGCLRAENNPETGATVSFTLPVLETNRGVGQ
jgi:two-component system, LuxR family, sensor kinase FixL